MVRSVFRLRALALRRYFRISHLCGALTCAVMFTRTRLWFICWATWIQLTPACPISVKAVSINILRTLRLSKCLFPLGTPTSILYKFLSPHVQHATGDLIFLVIFLEQYNLWRDELTSFLQFPEVSPITSSVSTSYTCQYVFIVRYDSWSSRPIRPICKFTGCPRRIFRFLVLYSRREEERFCTSL